MHFDDLDKMADDMAKRGFEDRDAVIEAWFTMIFTAFLWHRSVYMPPEADPIPSEFMGSRIPVYIG